MQHQKVTAFNRVTLYIESCFRAGFIYKQTNINLMIYIYYQRYSSDGAASQVVSSVAFTCMVPLEVKVTFFRL